MFYKTIIVQLHASFSKFYYKYQFSLDLWDNISLFR